MKVNIFDQNFSHTKASIGYDACCFVKPSLGEWVRNQMVWPGTTVFTDDMCYSNSVDYVKTDTKIAWLMESPGVNSKIYDNIHKIQHKFHKIMTFLNEESSLKLGISSEKYLNFPIGGAWVEPDFIVTKKTKLCSLIASTKNYLPGHKLRHEIANSYSNLDLYGTAYREVTNKSDALHDYAFSIVIENMIIPGYFTEKLIDCLLTRTVPVYVGDPEISKIFDINGFLGINDIDNLSFERYNSLFPIIESNFQKALEFRSIDDNVFKLIEKF